MRRVRFAIPGSVAAGAFSRFRAEPRFFIEASPQILPRDTQPSYDGDKDLEGRITLPAFNATHMRAMHVPALGEVLLR